MNNKTETPEEILGKKCGMTFDEDTYRIQTKLEYIISAMQEFSSQQNKELIEELETERKLGLKLNSDYTDLNTRLSAELSQQKELVDRLSKEINECLKQKDHEIFTLKQEIEVLKKERDNDDKLIFAFMEILESTEPTEKVKEVCRKVFLNIAEHYQKKYSQYKTLSTPTTEEKEEKGQEVNYCNCNSPRDFDKDWIGKSCPDCKKEIVGPF